MSEEKLRQRTLVEILFGGFKFCLIAAAVGAVAGGAAMAMQRRMESTPRDSHDDNDAGGAGHNALFAGPSRHAGESGDSFNQRRHDTRIDSWAEEKQRAGEWMSKEDYESVTGRPGRK